MSTKSESILEALDAIEKEISLAFANGQTVDETLVQRKARLVEELNEVTKNKKAVLNG